MGTAGAKRLGQSNAKKDVFNSTVEKKMLPTEVEGEALTYFTPDIRLDIAGLL